MQPHEIISGRQYIWLVIAFILGSAAIVFVGGGAKQDVWLAIILGLAEAMVFALAYLKLSYRFAGADIPTINDIVWGKYIGKAFTLAYIWYTLTLSSIVISDFRQFAELAMLPGIQNYPLDLPLAILLVIFVMYGIENIGRLATLITPLVIGFIIFVTILSLPYMDPNNLRPVLENPTQVISAAHRLSTFPFGETVAFFALIPNLHDYRKATRYTFMGLFLGALVILLLNLRNLMVLGTAIQYFTYSSYTAAKVINVAGFFTRMETFVAVNHGITSFFTAAILLYAASVTASGMLNMHRKAIAIPFGLIIMVLFHNNFPSAVHNFEYGERIYPFYAPIFQLALPLSTLVASIILNRDGTGGKAIPANNGRTR